MRKGVARRAAAGVIAPARARGAVPLATVRCLLRRAGDTVAVMVTPLARLDELGIALPEVVAPLAAYVPALRSGSLVFTAGQLPMVAGALPRTGKVGADVSA